MAADVATYQTTTRGNDMETTTNEAARTCCAGQLGHTDDCAENNAKRDRTCVVCGRRTSFGCIHTADGSAYGETTRAGTINDTGGVCPWCEARPESMHASTCDDNEGRAKGSIRECSRCGGDGEDPDAGLTAPCRACGGDGMSDGWRERSEADRKLGAAIRAMYEIWAEGDDHPGELSQSGSAADQCSHLYEVLEAHGLPVA